MKKLNKFFAVLVALAMMATLCVSMAFAENKAQNTTAAITKKLSLPKGFTLPSDFETQFTFELLTVDDVEQATTDTTGVIGNEGVVTITDESTKYTVAGTDAAPTDVYYFTTGDFLANVNFHGGKYVYKVTESKFFIDGTAATVDGQKILTDDDTEFYLTVQCNSAGTPTNVTLREGSEEASKTPFNPGPGENDVKENGFNFENSYYKINSGTTDDAVLSVTKDVTGEGADTSTGFEIKVTLVAPEGTGADLSGVEAFTRENAEAQAVPATGTNGVYTVYLKDGAKLFFNKVPEGTTYTIEETDTRAKLETETAKTAAYIKSGDLGTATLNGSAGAKTITNAYQTRPDTGVLMSNLPYIVLALVAIGGMVAYVVIRRRNADEA